MTVFEHVRSTFRKQSRLNRHADIFWYGQLRNDTTQYDPVESFLRPSNISYQNLGKFLYRCISN